MVFYHPALSRFRNLIWFPRICSTALHSKVGMQVGSHASGFINRLNRWWLWCTSVIEESACSFRKNWPLGLGIRQQFWSTLVIPLHVQCPCQTPWHLLIPTAELLSALQSVALTAIPFHFLLLSATYNMSTEYVGSHTQDHLLCLLWCLERPTELYHFIRSMVGLG